MASDINTVFSFIGTGLDTDSDLIAIVKGDSRFRKNMVLSDDGGFHILKAPLGNTEIGGVGPIEGGAPVGTNTVVGYVEDKESNGGIFFVRNSSNRDSIHLYNFNDNTISPIWENASSTTNNLSFPDNRIIDAVIIGSGDDKLLIWADGDYLKSLNVSKAIAGGYNNPITREELEFRKWGVKSGDNWTSISYYPILNGEPIGNVSGKIWQFALRLRYLDGSLSTISQYSKIAVPFETMPSGRLTVESKYHAIEVNFALRNESNLIKSTQLLARNLDIGEGAAGNWFVYDEFDYEVGLNQVIFKNDKNLGTVPDIDLDRPYSYVPDKVNHLEVLDENRLVVDAGEEGFNTVDVTATVIIDERSIPLSEEPFRINLARTVITGGDSWAVTATFSSSRDEYLEVQIGDYPFSVYTYGLTNKQIHDAVKEYYDAHPSVGGTITIISTSALISFQATVGYWDITYVVIRPVNTFKTLKTNAKYKLGVEYGFNGKRSPVYKLASISDGEEFEITTPDFSELSATETNYTLGMKIQLTSNPPEGATDFRFVSFGNDLSLYEEYLVMFHPNDITDNSQGYNMYLSEPYTVIKKTTLINRMRLAYGDEATSAINYGFDFQKGDVIRFVGSFNDPFLFTGSPEYTYTEYPRDVDIHKGIIEYKIDVVTATEIKFSSSAIRELKNASKFLFYDVWLIQIIRKKEGFDSIGQEVSDSIPIINHGAEHDITDWISDCYKTKQVFVNAANFNEYDPLFSSSLYSWMEKDRVSLFYDSRPLSRGRQNIVQNEESKRSLKMVRWSGLFLEESSANFLFTFDGLDYKKLDERNGQITKIEQMGNTLKVYQERKINSLYLKTKSSVDPNGNDNYVFDDSVMTDPRQSVQDFGCTHFSSFAKNIRTAYFFDIINGHVVADSPGGVRSLTEGKYKMHSYFKKKASDIIKLGEDNVQILGVYDDDLDMYIISFIANGSSSHPLSDTVAFYEPYERWLTHFSLPTNQTLNLYGRLSGKTILSFVDGVAYLHNSNEQRNYMWNYQFNTEIWLHANEQPSLNKLYDSIEVNGSEGWSCPDEDSIVITRPIQMQSRLPVGRFKRQEGIYRSEFLRNALNSSMAWIRSLLTNGIRLRGREMTVKMKNQTGGEVYLESVSVRSTVSK